MPQADTIPANRPDTIPQTIPPTTNLDSILAQSAASQDAPPAQAASAKPIAYGAKDSSYMLMDSMEMHLFGEAYVRYESYEITADYIVINFNNNIIEASRRTAFQPRIVFSSGEQKVAADKLKFNINTQKGIVEGARIRQSNLYIHGAKTKFVRHPSNDSLEVTDVVYNRNALITSCDHEHPHWGIRTTKLKLIPNEVAVMGPFNLEFAEIPSPIFFPYALAPLLDFQNASSGLIFPSNPFQVHRRRGVGVQGLGYYFAISDYLDLSVRADLFVRGSFGIRTNMNYKKRYKYSGRIGFDYARNKTFEANSLDPIVEPSFKISFNHNQDPKAHPYRTIGGSLTFNISDYDRQNNTDVRSQTNTAIASRFRINQRINDKWSANAEVSNTQNLLDGTMTVTLPQINLKMNDTYIFKRKGGSVNKEAWYEKIRMNYSSSFLSRVNTVDSLLFTSETLDKVRYGMEHSARLNANYRFLKYFSFNPSINYDEDWYFQTYAIELDENNEVQSNINRGFKPIRFLQFNATVQTNLFATLQLKRGRLRGLRLKTTPSVSLSYSPSQDSYYEYFDRDPNSAVDELVRYNPFSTDDEIFDLEVQELFSNANRNLVTGSRRFSYRLSNTLEAKVYNPNDTTSTGIKRVPIINNLNFSGNYNLDADSLRWSTVNMSGSMQLLKNFTRINFSGTFDPYLANDNNRRINRFVWNEKKFPVRLTRLNFNFSTTFDLEDIRQFLLPSEMRTENRRGSSRRSSGGEELYDWFRGFGFQHNLVLAYDVANADPFRTTTNSLTLRTGSIPLSTNWKMQISNLTYDFERGRFAFPSFSLSRDLHCWNMRMSWQPSRGTFSFYIGAKTAPFSDFLKYQTGRGVFDSVGF